MDLSSEGVVSELNTQALKCSKLLSIIKGLVEDTDSLKLVVDRVRTECLALRKILMRVHGTFMVELEELTECLETQPKIAIYFEKVLRTCTHVLEYTGVQLAVPSEESLSATATPLKALQKALNIFTELFQTDSVKAIRRLVIEGDAVIDPIESDPRIIETANRLSNAASNHVTPREPDRSQFEQKDILAELPAHKLSLIETNSTPAPVVSLLRSAKETPATIDSSHTLIPDNTSRGGEKVYLDSGSGEGVRNQARHSVLVELSQGDVNRLVRVITTEDEDKALVGIPDRTQNGDLHNFDGTTLLIEATKKDYVRVAEKLIASGVSVDAVDKEDNNALIWACRNGTTRMAELLLRNEASIEFAAEKSQRMTPLNWAAYSGKVEVVKFLLEKGANIESADNDLMTPLHNASQFGYDQVIELLLAKGANVQAVAKDGMNVVHYAALNGHPDAVRLLIKNNAGYNEINEKRNTPLILATIRSQVPAMKALLGNGLRSTIDFQGQDQFAAIHEAAVQGNVELLEVLLSHNAKIETKSSGGLSPLHHAVVQNHIAFATRLLACGADVHSASDDGTTPIKSAVLRSHEDMTSLLLKHGAKVGTHSADEEKWSSLHAAAMVGHVGVVRILLDHGLFIDNQQNEQRVTPLMCACLSQQPDLVDFLLKQGANIGIRNKDGAQAVFWAVVKGNSTILEALIKKGASLVKLNEDGNNAAQVAAMNDHVEVLDLVIKKGLKIDCETESGRTLLHIAAEHGSTKVVKHLVEKHGASVKAKDNDWYQPLHVASWGGHVEILEFLIQHGAPVNAISSNNQTALMGAAANDNMEAVELLLLKGADINTTMAGEGTALDFAIIAQKDKMVEYLLKRGAKPELPQARQKEATILLAAEKGNEAVIQKLIDHGAQVNYRCPKTSQTAIMVAAGEGHFDAVTLLIDNGARLDDVDDTKGSAIVRAIMAERPDIIRLLIQRGASLEVHAGEAGLLPLHVAAAVGNLEICKCLVENGANVWAENFLSVLPIEFAREHNDDRAVTKYLERQMGQ